MPEQLEYRTTRDFQEASREIFAILQTDLNGHNARRARGARQVYEFVALLLGHTQKLESKANSRAAELLKLKGALEFLSKRVVAEAVQGEDQEAGP
jgi:hypothetical protein